VQRDWKCKTMEPIIQQIAGTPTMARLWRLMTSYFRSEGFGAGCYYLLQTANDRPAAVPYSYGFSQEVVDTYVSLDFRHLDVVPRRVLALGHPLAWDEAWDLSVPTEEERAFQVRMLQVLSGPGYGLPCYGPRQRNAYVALSQFAEDRQPDAARLWALQFVAQAAHLRLCELFRCDDDLPRLSVRETEILGWVAFGKSNSVIADILQISPDTVDTYMRRIYRKFDVYDRTSAAIKGVGMGLIAA
jgi:DNA-binding CsgD family transcriptional regulator